VKMGGWASCFEWRSNKGAVVCRRRSTSDRDPVEAECARLLRKTIVFGSSPENSLQRRQPGWVLSDEVQLCASRSRLEQ